MLYTASHTIYTSYKRLTGVCVLSSDTSDDSFPVLKLFGQPWNADMCLESGVFDNVMIGMEEIQHAAVAMCVNGYRR